MTISDETSSEAASEPKTEKDGGSKVSRNVETETSPNYASPSMTLSLFFYWIVPMLLIAVYSRKLANTEVPIIATSSEKKGPGQDLLQKKRKKAQSESRQTTRTTPSHERLAPQSWPSEYLNLIKSIESKRRRIIGFPGDISNMFMEPTTSFETDQTSPHPTPQRVPNNDDPQKAKYHGKIDLLRKESQENPSDIYKAIALADSMRFYDMQYHEGGTFEQESIQLYDEILRMAKEKRSASIAAGKTTNVSHAASSLNEEVTLEYKDKSVDGMLCGIYTAKGKVYFMANMFERAVESYNGCLDDIGPTYLDALNARASSQIVLGRYKDAGKDYGEVIRRDQNRFFVDAYTGMARVLEADEESVSGGWTSVVEIIEKLIPVYEQQLLSQPQSKPVFAGALNRLYHVLFTYHEAKTKDYPMAFKYLEAGFKHKLSILPKWNAGAELAKIVQTKNIFTRGFWPGDMGSRTTAPIFIIGFVRSGSTLLERILDAHPLIAGTGENSVFNGRLGDIRNQIVVESTTGGANLAGLTKRLGDEVVAEMQQRWKRVDMNTERADEDISSQTPVRFVDKMLTNYYNVGFIQMLYPDALILHVAREPMDSIFSAFKHEFPAGTLDYTSDYVGLSELYDAYRTIIEHWDDVLPGRIHHIRYEDMVKDFEGTARAIIKATGLPWDDSVLEFHKKKHAVNTLSSTQVRQGVYTKSLKSWMRYEEQLQPLISHVGERVNYDIKTTLPGYSRNGDDESQNS